MTDGQALTTADLAVLNMERAPSSMHIAVAVLLDRSPDSAVLTQRMADCALRYPRLRQFLVDGSRPHLVEDPEFAVERHVCHLPPLAVTPGARISPSEAKDRLFASIATGFTQPMDRAHPLWRVYVASFAPGPDAPSWSAVCTVIHHAVSDGMGLVELTRSLRDVRPPVPAEASRAGGDDGAPGRLPARDQLRMFRQLAVDALRPHHRSAFSGTPGTTRDITTWEFSREDIRSFRRTFGCSLSAALLAISSGAFRRYQQAHGFVTTRELTVFYPMSTRTIAEWSQLGNRFVTFRVPLGVPLERPEQRVQHCEAELQQVAALQPLRMSERVSRRIAHLPRAWQRKLADSPGRLTNLVFTLLPMSLAGATIAGARVLGTYPLPALLGQQGAAVGFMFDSGSACGALVSDPTLVPDPGQLRAAFLDSLAEYLECCPV